MSQFSEMLATAKLKMACVNAAESEEVQGKRREVDLHDKGLFLLILRHKVVGQ